MIQLNNSEPGQLASDINELKRQVTALSSSVASLQDQLKQSDGTRINLFDIFGSIEVVTSAPASVPRDIYEQVKIYSTGGTYRLYVYDYTGGGWRYTALT